MGRPRVTRGCRSPANRARGSGPGAAVDVRGGANRAIKRAARLADLLGAGEPQLGTGAARVILDDYGISYAKEDSLLDLYKKVADAMALSREPRGW
jgi:hypothetical protein